MSTTLKALQRLEKMNTQPESYKAAAAGLGRARYNQKPLKGGRVRLSKTGFMVLLAVVGLSTVFLLITLSPSKKIRSAAMLPAKSPELVETTVGAPVQSMPQTDGPMVPPALPSPSPPAETTLGGIVHAPEMTVLPWRGEGINVQAIVAGSNPDASLAVINNATVRRGDRVGGDYVIAAIEKDAVIVSRGGERWRVVLGR